MTTRINAKQLETPVGNAKLVALGRVSGAAHFPDEESPVQYPGAFSEAQQDHGIDQGRDSNSRERVFSRGAGKLVGEETRDAAILASNHEPHSVFKRGLLRAHAHQGGERVSDHEPRLEYRNFSQRRKQMVLRAHCFGHGRQKTQGTGLQRGP